MHTKIAIALFLFVAPAALAGCAPQDGEPADPGLVGCDVPVLPDLDPAPGVVEVDLVADETPWSIAAGVDVPGFAYEGQVPGPMIVVDAGSTLRVHFRNDLDTMPTTVHWHGLRVPDTQDGVPMIMNPVQPGGTFEYEFVVPDPGFYWYHPHMSSDLTIDKGLYGLLWVRDPAGEPQASCDLPVALDDVTITSAGTVREPGMHDRMTGSIGSTLLANGRADRRVEVRPGAWVLLRMVNVANARYFDLAFDGGPFTVLGTDGGWLEDPYETERLVVAPSERYVVAVKADGLPGDELALVTYREPVHPGGSDPLGPGPNTVMRLLLSGDPASEPAPVPPTVALPAWDPAPASLAHTWVLDQEMMSLTIDGASWPDVPMVSVPGNQLTYFGVRNDAPGRHPFHLHGQRFQVVAADGVPETRRAWKDSVDVPAGTTLTIASELDNPGHWMLHCHINEHGEDGMMAELEVTP